MGQVKGTKGGKQFSLEKKEGKEERRKVKRNGFAERKKPCKIGSKRLEQ